MIENREKEREEGRKRERERKRGERESVCVLEIRRKIYIILTCEQFGLNTFYGEGKRLLTVSH